MKKINLTNVKIGKSYICINKEDHKFFKYMSKGSIRAIGKIISIDDINNRLYLLKKPNNKNNKAIKVPLSKNWYNFYEID